MHRFVLGKYINLLLIIAVPESTEQTKGNTTLSSKVLSILICLPGDAVPPLPPMAHRLLQWNHCLVTIHNTDISFSYFGCRELTAFSFGECKCCQYSEVWRWWNECIATHALQTQIQLVKRLIKQGQEARTFVTEKWVRRAKKQSDGHTMGQE